MSIKKNTAKSNYNYYKVLPLLTNNLTDLIKDQRISIGIQIYELIQEEFTKPIHLFENGVFMFAFDNFYKLSVERKQFKNQKNYSSFFKKFDRFKNRALNGKKVTYNQILKSLKRITNENEKVFASKIFHTIYPDQPIFDSILKNHFIVTGNIKNYGDYCKRFSTYKNFNGEAKKIITAFDKKFPGNKLTDTKKLDFVLWADR